jgi:putative membrane protein
VKKGDATAQQYGELYATLEKGAERAQSEAMIVGAPEGAIGLAAYSYEIAGETGEGDRNLFRALGGLALLAAAGGVVFLRRRLA